MHPSINDRLAGTFESYSIDSQLHDVPPHAVYRVTVDGQAAVYKGDIGPTGSAGMEGQVMAFVASRTSLPVPTVLHLSDDWFVTAWDEAAPTPGGSIDGIETWAHVAGRAMATLHRESEQHIDRFGRFTTNGDGLTVEGDSSWHRSAIAYLERRRPVLDRYGHAEMADVAIEALQSRPDAFEGSGSPVCCHGWFTPEHVAVEDDAVTCVVDFEHAMAAPAAYDIWRMAIPTFGPDRETLDTFLAAYREVRPLPSDIEARRPYFSVLILVYYFESLYVQEQFDQEETEAKASELRDALQTRLDELP